MHSENGLKSGFPEFRYRHKQPNLLEDFWNRLSYIENFLKQDIKNITEQELDKDFLTENSGDTTPEYEISDFTEENDDEMEED